MTKTRRQEIGARLRVCRVGLGMSQADVGAELGLSDKTISAYEAGDRVPGMLTLADLCLVYGVSADYVLLGLDTVPRDLRDLLARV